MSSLTITRRSFAQLAAGVAAGAVLSPYVARAQGKRLSVVVSAVYKRSFDRYVVPKMKELHGIDVAASALLSSEALARAIAQKDNPQISLFTLDQGPWLQGKDLGLWQALDTGVARNLADVAPSYRDPDGLGTALMTFMTGFCYDETALKAANLAPPESFFDMWKPEFKNRIALPQFTNTFAFITLAETSRLLGAGSKAPYDAAFARMKELKPNVRTFIGPLGQVIQLFQQKEIWLAFAPQLSAMQAAATGLPIKWKAPRENAVAASHFVAVPKGAPNAEDAQKLVDLMVSPGYQKVLSETDFMVPVNGKTSLDPAFAANFPVTPAIVADAAQVPWAEYNTHRVALAERWQREIQA
jgi:putative spermidine/putrescine transport system substrate-binding protein